MAKRIAVLSGAAALALVTVILAIWLYIGRTGGSDLENWIGRQIIGVLQSHLTPEISFETLDYQYPRTVVVDNLAFTAERRPILHVVRARLELAEIPQRGKPILIQNVELNTPKLQFITNEAGDLIGWSHFVKTEAIRHPETVPPGQRLSDVLVLRHVGIDNGEVIYQEGFDQTSRMTLPGISLRLATPPVEDQPGWYRLIGGLEREPLIDLQLDGRINLDTGLLDVARLQLAASLGERQYGTLPPALQDFLRQHEIQGALQASGQGQLPLNAPDRFAGTLRAQLRDARFRHRGTVLPVETVTVDAQLPEGGINVSIAGIELARHEGGEPLPLLSVQSITARLAGIPAKDQPLVVEELQVDRPHVVLAARAQGGLAGWSHLAQTVRRTGNETPEPPPDADEPDILQAVDLRRFAIAGGSVTYRPAAGEPFTLDNIEIALTGRPQENATDVVDVKGTLQAGPLVKADLAGRLDTRAARFELNRFVSVADVGPDSYELLPPRPRDWMKQHEARGRIVVTGEGTFPLTRAGEPKFVGAAEVTSAHVRLNGVSVPVGHARVQLAYPERQIEATATDVRLISEGLPFLSLPRLTAKASLQPDGPAALDELLLEEPTVSLVKSADGGLVGWNRLPASDEPLSFVIREARAVSGTLAYAPGGPDELARIGGIGLTLRSADPDDPQSPLAVSASVEDESLRAQLAGSLDTTLMRLDVREFRADTALAEDRYARLPEAVRSVLVPYQPQGQLSVTASGTLPLLNASAARLDVTGHIRAASFLYRGLRVPVGEAEVRLGFPDKPFSVVAREVSVSHGELALARAAQVSLQSPAPPWAAGPVQFDRITLDEPRVLLVSQEEGFAGWSSLGENDQGEPDQTPGPILAQLRVNNGELVYASAPGREVLALPGINIAADLEPGPQGWYRVASHIRQGQSLNMDLQGRFSPADQLFELASLNLRARLTGQDHPSLSPALKSLVGEHDLRGTFAVDAQGRIPLKDPGQLEGRLSATAREGMFSYEKTQWPVKQLDLNAEANRGVISGRLNAAMLGGTVRANGRASLPRGGTFELDWQVTDAQIENMMRAVQPEAKKPDYAGVLDSRGQLRGRLGEWPQSLSGSGELLVEKGRLLRLPLIRNVVVRLLTLPLDLALGLDDRATVDWAFRPSGVDINKMTLASPLISLEGRGELSYDGRVNMSFSAQPIQRMPRAFGEIGNIIKDIGRLGGRMVTLEVRGHISDPKVTPAPLGITGK